LLSNDDGIHAIGLAALATALESVGEVWVVAPDRERSATSHAISLHQPLRMRGVAERRYAVDGTPTDCVYLGLNHVLPEPPSLVIGGINLGPNLGNDVLYSGTVAVAMEGALAGFPALAVSLCVGDSGSPDCEAAAYVARSLALSIIERPMARGVMLNVNVPAVPRDCLRGLKLCRLGYNDWADAVGVRHDPRGKPYYWLGGERLSQDGIADSDYSAISTGYVSITPIHYDMTDYRAFDYVRGVRVSGLTWSSDALGNDPLPYPPHPKG
jgi:5'-nucleotidase